MLGMFCLCQRPVTAHGCSRCPLWQPCAATGRWHYSIIRTMTPSNHALRVSFVCSKAWVVCSCLRFVCIVATATVVLQHSSKFVATIAVTARLKFVWQGRVYIRCCREGDGGGRTTSILAVRVWLFGSSGPSHLCGWDSPAPMWARHGVTPTTHRSPR